MKAVAAAFNQEKALLGAFFVIVQLRRFIVNSSSPDPAAVRASAEPPQAQHHAPGQARHRLSPPHPPPPGEHETIFATISQQCSQDLRDLRPAPRQVHRVRRGQGPQRRRLPGRHPTDV